MSNSNADDLNANASELVRDAADPLRVHEEEDEPTLDLLRANAQHALSGRPHLSDAQLRSVVEAVDKARGEADQHAGNGDPNQPFDTGSRDEERFVKLETQTHALAEAVMVVTETTRMVARAVGDLHAEIHDLHPEKVATPPTTTP